MNTLANAIGFFFLQLIHQYLNIKFRHRSNTLNVKLLALAVVKTMEETKKADSKCDWIFLFSTIDTSMPEHYVFKVVSRY